MGHRNSPLTPEGRRRLCERIDRGRPIAHVATEAGVSRATLGKWYGRWRELGEAGLLDRSSRPTRAPAAIGDDIVDAILELRRTEKWGNERIAAHLADRGVRVSASTVRRTFRRHDLGRVRDMDPASGQRARVVRYEHQAAGDMVHVDIKKVGRIPTGGGWAVHQRGTERAKASKRQGPGTGRVGYAYVHSAVDDYSRLAYSEVLPDERAATAVAFWVRTTTFFGSYGIGRLRRALTDNGSCYRSRAWSRALDESGTRHRRTRPYTPRTNGKVERYNGTLGAEWLRRRAYDSEQDRTDALVDFLNYYNLERPHSALGWAPPVSRTPVAGPRVEARAEEQLVELTPEQMSIFDL